MRRSQILGACAMGAALAACSAASSSNHESSGGGNDGGTANVDAGLSGTDMSPNCASLASTCGSSQGESCCASELVTGGSYARSYDAVTYTDQSFAATVSDFQLDRFPVTVGRFRSFVTAMESGWLPAGGSGKHTQLNGGGGLNGGTEDGWDPQWTSLLATARPDWDTNLLCDPTLATWTSSAGNNEDLPINCLEWQEAYAFCIWDGGFLPTEAEWNYAAAGGNQQRVYPWSSPASATAISCADANYNPGPACSSPIGLVAVGSESPAGDGTFGQADLVGNLWQWQLDYFAAPFAINPCNDCADLTSVGVRSIRGGSFDDDATFMAVSYRHNYSQTGHNPLFGVRCARAPSSSQ